MVCSCATVVNAQALVDIAFHRITVAEFTPLVGDDEFSRAVLTDHFGEETCNVVGLFACDILVIGPPPMRSGGGTFYHRAGANIMMRFGPVGPNVI